jgi:hypothetical protein
LPTAQQGIRCVILCQSLTDTFTPIVVVRLDEQTGNLFMLAGDNYRDSYLSQWSVEVYLVKSDFSTMTKGELRAYVIAHPDDRTAFYTFVDRFANESSSEIYDLPNSTEEIDRVDFLIKQKLSQLKTR